MTGRPSDYTPEIVEAICARIANGESLRQICRDERMPDRSTVHRWLAAHEAFRDQYALAREAMMEHFADEILEIADDGSNDWMERETERGTVTVVDHEHISRSKERIETRKWLMGKCAPKKYGDKTQMQVTGADGGPIAMSLEVAFVEPRPAADPVPEKA